MHRRRSSDSDAIITRPSRPVNVPFSWENKPGMPKVAAAGHNRDHKVLSKHLSMEHLKLKLKPPPRMSSLRSSSARFTVVDRQSRLPLCSIQPSLRLNSFRSGGVKEKEDPFLAAFMKCTAKSPNTPAENGKKYGGEKIKTVFSFSCKYSCGVKEDSIVPRMPHSPKY